MGNKPQIGQIVMHAGKQYRIVRIHPFGTVDVVSLDGQHSYRVSGLSF